MKTDRVPMQDIPEHEECFKDQELARETVEVLKAYQAELRQAIQSLIASR